jgi:hypothetical protein
MFETVVILILVALCLFLLVKRGKEGYQEPEDYYANWNYSPYYTPLPVNELSYLDFYTPIPELINRWSVR